VIFHIDFGAVRPVLRAASGDGPAPKACPVAGDPRPAPAIVVLIADPAQCWKSPGLTGLCSTSRATVMGHFQTAGRSFDRVPVAPHRIAPQISMILSRIKSR
jgi:hypothetical protein